MAEAPTRYPPATATAVADLVYSQPLAWIVSGGGQQTTPLPLRPELGADGQVTALIGHFARRNPQVEALKTDPRALVLFMGPHAYISPSWLTDRTQAPSWNYASAAFQVEVEFVEEGAFTRAVMADLIDAMEAGRDKAWRLEDMGERYDRIRRGVVAFRAVVTGTQPAFKLGQDERDDVYAEILSGLEADGDGALAALMRVHNPGR